jgi:hypothetical protein
MIVVLSDHKLPAVFSERDGESHRFIFQKGVLQIRFSIALLIFYRIFAGCLLSW